MIQRLKRHYSNKVLDNSAYYAKVYSDKDVYQVSDEAPIICNRSFIYLRQWSPDYKVVSETDVLGFSPVCGLGFFMCN